MTKVHYIEATYEATVYWDDICNNVYSDYGFVLTIDMVKEIYAKYAEIVIELKEPVITEPYQEEVSEVSLGQGCFADNDYKWPLRFYVTDDRYNELYRGGGQVLLDEQTKAHAQEEKRKQLEKRKGSEEE